MQAIINGKLILPDVVVENKIILIENGKITQIVDVLPTEADIIDAKGLFVAPGFVDVHIHGSKGCDVMDGTTEGLLTIARSIAKFGTTSFLPTTLTMAKKDIYNALDTITSLKNAPTQGAEILGAHLEGPFINVAFKGAQNPDYIIKPDFQWIKDYSDTIKLITYAPEMDENLEFTKQVKENTNATLSMGHSAATYKQALDAIAEGCSHVTHLFNGMPSLHHREPGILGAALTQDVYTELIADKIHVNEHLFQFVLDNKGEKKIVLITDSMRAGCMKDGIYDLGGQDVFVENNKAVLKDGTLAGSILTMNDAVKNFYLSTNATLSQAVHAASLNPAASINQAHLKGSLEVGKDADIIFIDDDFNCLFTIVKGEIVFKNL